MSSGIVYNIQRMSGQDGPGLRTTVFLKGCPLSCMWCSNPESQNRNPQLLVFSKTCTGCGACLNACPQGAVFIGEDGKSHSRRDLCVNCGLCASVCRNKAREISGKTMSVDDVIKVVAKDELFYHNSDGGVTFCGGEPTMAGPYLVELMEACRKRGYHICLDTCGFCAPENFETMMKLADLLLFDCKHMDPARHKELTGVDNAIILANLRMALEQNIPVRIRIPLMPGINDTEENIAALAAFLKPYGKNEVDVLPCHTFGGSKYEALDMPQPAWQPYKADELQEACARFERHGLKPVIVK